LWWAQDGNSRFVCQNIDIHSTQSKSSQVLAARQFQEDLMVNFWSSGQRIEHFLVFWALG